MIIRFDDGLKRKEEEYRRMSSNDRSEKPKKTYKEEDYTIKRRCISYL